MIPVPFTNLIFQDLRSKSLRGEIKDPVMLWEAAPGNALHLGEEGPTRAGVEGAGPTVEDPLVFLFTRELNRPGVTDLTIGRSDECNLVVNHESVSRVHAKLDRDAVTKRWRLTDLGSRLGTKVEGMRLIKGVPELLMDRVRVELGEVMLRFMSPAAFFAYLDKMTEHEDGSGPE
ncbi:MAG TPA: FHA domain-containing protein [Myxococcaceae bacterium]|nr:FHA domain-containing protein [Myxococcaceae bacterium]